MKFYRVAYHNEQDPAESAGFAWFTNRRDALAAAKSQQADGPDAKSAEPEMIEVAPTKTGILKALNDYASHPDNG
jgi:hypothetical protein